MSLIITDKVTEILAKMGITLHETIHAETQIKMFKNTPT